jgi:hypothetical protein
VGCGGTHCPVDWIVDIEELFMTKDEALKLALEVMHDQGDVGVDEWIAAEAAIKQALAAPVQVSPLEFVTMVMEKEHLVGKPLFWAEWPNKEKNT